MRIERLSPRHTDGFREFLAALHANGDNNFFHPHGFSTTDACEIVQLSAEGLDEYWVAVDGSRVIAYGLLRGWREGYAVPSAGIAVGPADRGRGHARTMMQHLHAIARTRGARQVRLKVDRRNESAIRLYESLGYTLKPHDDHELLGLCDLADP